MTIGKFFSLTAAATMVVTSFGITTAASAQDRYRDGRGDYSRDHRDRDRAHRDYRHDRYQGDRYRNDRYANYRYRGDRDPRAYRCNNDGTAGTIIGAIAGGLIGNSVAGRHGDRTTGTIIGGAVGAVAGRAIDRGDGRC